MDDFIPVEPTDVVRSCVKIRISINNFQLKATTCNVSVQKYDAGNRMIDLVDVFINEEEYSQWSYDDQYIIDLVLSKLGMTPTNVDVEV